MAENAKQDLASANQAINFLCPWLLAPSRQNCRLLVGRLFQLSVWHGDEGLRWEERGGGAKIISRREFGGEKKEEVRNRNTNKLPA